MPRVPSQDVTEPHKDKFEPKTKPHVFMCYLLTLKVYNVLNIATKKIHVSRDVYFYESIFLFSIPSSWSSFPSILRSVDSFHKSSGQ